MKSRDLIIGISCLIVGLTAGFFAANSINRGEVAQQTAANTTASVPVDASSVPSGGGIQSDVSATLERANAEPQSFAAQMKAGDMYAQIGRFDQAIEFYKRGVLINPSNFKANVVLANALFDSQKFEESEEYYAKALSIEPNDADARTDLAATLIERSSPEYDRAIAELNKVRASAPSHKPSLYYLGIAALRKGDKAGAQTIMAQLEKIDPASELVGKLRQNIESRPD